VAEPHRRDSVRGPGAAAGVLSALSGVHAALCRSRPFFEVFEPARCRSEGRFWVLNRRAAGLYFRRRRASAGFAGCPRTLSFLGRPQNSQLRARGPHPCCSNSCGLASPKTTGCSARSTSPKIQPRITPHRILVWGMPRKRAVYSPRCSSCDLG